MNSFQGVCIMQKNVFGDWFTRLPEESVLFTLSTGSGRKLEQVYKVVTVDGVRQGYSPNPNSKNECFQAEDIDDVQDQLVQVLEDTGFGTEYEKARVYAYAVDGTPIKNKLVRQLHTQPTNETDSTSINALCTALIAMSNETRRTLAVVTDSNQHFLSVISQLTENTLSARRDQVAAEQERLAYELVLDHAVQEENSTVKEQGLNVLQQIFQTLASKQNQGIDIDALKEHLKSNPDVVDDFINDPDIVESVMQSMARNASDV